MWDPKSNEPNEGHQPEKFKDENRSTDPGQNKEREMTGRGQDSS